jgi:ABC-2 type transport system permease protein
MFYRIANLIQKEVIQVNRDRVLVVVLILGPALQLFLLAWNTGRGVANLPLVVLDLDHSATSRAIITALDNTKELIVVQYAADLKELTRLVEAGDAEVGVAIPAGLERGLKAPGRRPNIQIIASGTNTIVGKVGLSAAEQAIANTISGIVSPAGTSRPAIDLRTTVLFNPTLNSRNYTIPAMIGLIVFELTLVLASLGLTRERETGTLEQLIIMPFHRLELIAGKAAAPLLITLVDFALMLLIAVYVFGTPMRGSVGLLFGLTILFMLAEIGWGLTLSTIARTQQQAVLFVFVQAIFDMTFSGFLVPVESLPPLLAFVSNFVPLSHYLVIIRGVMLKASTLAVLAPQVIKLAVLTLAIGAVAVLSIGRRVD